MKMKATLGFLLAVLLVFLSSRGAEGVKCNTEGGKEGPACAGDKPRCMAKMNAKKPSMQGCYDEKKMAECTASLSGAEDSCVICHRDRCNSAPRPLKAASFLGLMLAAAVVAVFNAYY